MKYVGKHSGNKSDMLRSYYGTNEYLRNSMKKHGVENFSYEILEECNSSEEAYKREYEISLQLNVVDNKNYYNFRLGGAGPPCGKLNHRYNKAKTEEQKLKQSIRMSGENNPMFGKTHSEEARYKISECTKKQFETTGHPLQGKKHSEETKNKIRKARAKQVGEFHPSFKGYWFTPKGKFATAKEAAIENNCTRETIINRTKSENFLEYYRVNK